MKYQIFIDTGNASFEDYNTEVEEMLLKAATYIKQAETGILMLFDTTGNTCGLVECVELNEE